MTLPIAFVVIVIVIVFLPCSYCIYDNSYSCFEYSSFLWSLLL